MKEGDEELIEKGLKHCKEFLGGSWGNVSREQLDVTKVLGGLSNTLFKFSLKDNYATSPNEQRHVLLRVYGEVAYFKEDTLLNDSVTFALLSERNMGPKLYGTFTWGRLEEYIPSRVLTTPELRKTVISRACARIMCRFHQLNMPMNKQPRWLFEFIQRYLNEALKIVENKDYTPLVDLNEEYNQLKIIISKIKSPVVFCHNDLQEGNLLYVGEQMQRKCKIPNDAKENGSEHDNDVNAHGNDSDDRDNDGDDNDYHYDASSDILRPIDFEYSSYNYRGYDIGNHFCEWCYDYQHPTAPFFKADLSAYPDRQQQLMFLREYIREKKLIRSKSIKSGMIFKEDEEEDDEESMLLEVNGFALAAHFVASIWSLVQSKKSHIHFGYLEYSEKRLEAYLTLKPKVMQMLNRYNLNKKR